MQEHLPPYKQHILELESELNRLSEIKTHVMATVSKHVPNLTAREAIEQALIEVVFPLQLRKTDELHAFKERFPG